MRSIAIIGAGQSGLLLAFALKLNNYDVVLFNNKSADEIRDGFITSSQVVFDSALKVERLWGTNLWEKSCPQNYSISFSLRAPDSLQKAIEWKGLTKKPFQSVDQRLKFSTLLNKFEDLGGKVVIKDIQLCDLQKIAEDFELTILSTGKNEIKDIFQRDDHRSSFTAPARTLACMYVKGMIPQDDNPGVRANIIPGIGEYFTTPGLTLSGNCEMMLFEAIPKGPFDVFSKHDSPEEILSSGLTLLKKHIPWEAEKCKNIELTDSKAVLVGSFTPVVKKPVASISPNNFILGMGDVVVLNDPIAGQGANNAIKCAEVYLKNILKQEKKAFDSRWMNETFEEYWTEYAEPATRWSNLLLSPPPPHIIDLLAFASHSPPTAEKLANAFDSPASLFPWIEDPEYIANMIQE